MRTTTSSCGSPMRYFLLFTFAYPIMSVAIDASAFIQGDQIVR